MVRIANVYYLLLQEYCRGPWTDGHNHPKPGKEEVELPLEQVHSKSLKTIILSTMNFCLVGGTSNR